MDLNELESSDETPLLIEKMLPHECRATPFTNFAGFRLLTKLCLHKSKIAQGMYDQALLLLGQVSVGDQRLHDVLDAADVPDKLRHILKSVSIKKPTHARERLS